MDSCWTTGMCSLRLPNKLKNLPAMGRWSLPTASVREIAKSAPRFVSKTGVRYIKIKVANNLEHDLERIKAIAQIIERHRGDDYNTTIDGNEQYETAEDFDVLVDRMKGTAELETFWKNTLCIEQPLPGKL